MSRYSATVVALLVFSGNAYSESSTGTVSCLPAERVACGCALSIKNGQCEGGRSQYQFYSELLDGAPLWMGIYNHQIELKSNRMVADKSGFLFSEGDSWSETYVGDGVSVKIGYRPGKETCPKDKGDDSCEYFDVDATVHVKANGTEKEYQAVGVCGC